MNYLKQKKFVMELAIVGLSMMMVSAVPAAFAQTSTNQPSVEIIRTLTENQGVYSVLVKVSSGNEALTGTLVVTSDIASYERDINIIRGGLFTTEELKVRANNPSSISANLEVGSNVIEEIRGFSPSYQDGAFVAVSSVLPIVKNFYEVNFDIYSGENELNSGKLQVTSDMGSEMALYRGVQANSLTSASVQIAAMDLNSIRATVHPFENTVLDEIDLKKKYGMDPKVVLDSIIPIGNDAYEVMFEIHAGSSSVPSGTLVVETDSETETSLFSSIRPNSVTTATVTVVADDTSSIKATIQS